MKQAEIHLPYFKQGDDLSHHLTHCNSVEEALEGHAKQLEFAATILRGVRSMVAEQGVEMDADTHMIMVSGPDEIIEALVDAKYATIPTWDDDGEEYEDDEDREADMKTGWDRYF